MSKDEQKIDADDRTVFDVLNERKYTIDYFQREYSWARVHIEQLITDLASSFLGSFTDGDKRTAVQHYSNYYLGPFVVSSKAGLKSIIDGQQRLTSITLLLIFLNNLQRELGGHESVEPLIFSEKYGEKSFNIQVEERRQCLEQLFVQGLYNQREGDDESTVNMAARYADIVEAFPEELRGAPLPYFIDWLKYNVVLVEITAYSDDNAYSIFESMNDRGLNLTSSEMLKGYILSRFQKAEYREAANRLWKENVQRLRSYGKEEDQKFFQAWFRSQYADTIRQSKAGSSNEDFEKVGTRFHSWFRDNLAKAGLKADVDSGFRVLLHEQMRFFVQAYCDILDAQKEERPGWESVFYHSKWGVADSLSLPLMLAPLNVVEPPEISREKINVVAAFLECFAVRRSINFRNFGASSIRYTMYSLVKDLRGRDLASLKSLLSDRLQEMQEGWGGLSNFRLHGMNRYFVKFLLSRVTAFVEQSAGLPTNFSTYFVANGSRPFEVEHIWADKFNEHRNEFDQKHDFENYRNRIGDLVLLPQGTNQSYGSMPFVEKRGHYLKENLFVKSLHPKTYENNPNFIGLCRGLDLSFKPYSEFGKADIDERQQLVRTICERIWGVTC